MPLIYALILAAFAFVPGLVVLALAFATAGAVGPRDPARPEGAGCLGAVHGVSRGAGSLLLAIACGFVGAGLFSLCLNGVLIAIALISYSVSPTAGEDLDEGLFGPLYLGALFVSFLGFFALGMSRLVRWLGPKHA